MHPGPPTLALSLLSCTLHPTPYTLQPGLPTLNPKLLSVPSWKGLFVEVKADMKLVKRDEAEYDKRMTVSKTLNPEPQRFSRKKVSRARIDFNLYCLALQHALPPNSPLSDAGSNNARSQDLPPASGRASAGGGARPATAR